MKSKSEGSEEFNMKSSEVGVEKSKKFEEETCEKPSKFPQNRNKASRNKLTSR